jgi:hypothetical protein
MNEETNREFNIKLKAGADPDAVAASLGFVNKGKVFDNWYTFEHKSEVTLHYYDSYLKALLEQS